MHFLAHETSLLIILTSLALLLEVRHVRGDTNETMLAANQAVSNGSTTLTGTAQQNRTMNTKDGKKFEEFLKPAYINGTGGYCGHEIWSKRNNDRNVPAGCQCAVIKVPNSRVDVPGAVNFTKYTCDCDCNNETTIDKRKVPTHKVCVLNQLPATNVTKEQVIAICGCDNGYTEGYTKTKNASFFGTCQPSSSISLLNSIILIMSAMIIILGMV